MSKVRDWIVGGLLLLVILPVGCQKLRSLQRDGLIDPGATAELVKLPHARAQLNAPAGWTKYESSDWTKFRPADNLARLALVSFGKQSEATARVGEIATQLGLGQVAWGTGHNDTIGPDLLPARTGDGTCKIGPDPCYVWYATVDAGGAERILIVYAVNATAGQQHKTNAQAAVRSLRKL